MVYIQSDSERKLPHHFDCACGLWGAIDNALDYRLTSFDEVASGKFDMLIRKNVFIGSVEFMREVFKRIGLDDVRLPVNSNRDCQIITLAEAHKRVENGEKLFIKLLEIKLFTGLVLDGMKYSCLHGVPDDTKVMTYQPFNSKIVSEWRLYVHNRQIIDSRNYSGDFMISPNYDYAKSVIADYPNFPCAYTIDIGVLSSGENVVVEFNDMWAIGNYGIPNDLYFKMLKDRYFEIVG
jgi:ATP-grasp domain, R2K clade family 2